MGFRFRKSVRILPGVRLNISKGGVSTTIGRRGATINLGKRGVRGTVGLPGTGLFYSEMLARKSPRRGVISPDGFGSARGAGVGGRLIVTLIVAATLLSWVFG